MPDPSPPLSRPLTRGVTLLAHIVDALELTCSFAQVGLEYSGTEPLEELLAGLQEQAREYRPRTSVAAPAWSWESMPVLVHHNGQRPGSRFCLETEDWMLFVAAIGPRAPRFSVQLRADYLLRVGPLKAYRDVRAWVEANLLPLVAGRPREDIAEGPRWRILRLDLAADVLGVKFDLARLEDFTTRAKKRSAKSLQPGEHPDDAGDVYFTGRKLTGFTIGTRGAPTYARIYDKTAQAAADASIREYWTAARGRPLDSGAPVWRVEFELRSKFIRSLASPDGQHVSTDPETVLTEHLDAAWKYLTGSWLTLRTAEDRDQRRTRREVEPWWAALTEATGLNHGTGMPALVRKPRSTPNIDRAYAQMRGHLAVVLATDESKDLPGLLQGFKNYLVESGGLEGLRAAATRAKRRFPGAYEQPRAEAAVAEPDLFADAAYLSDSDPWPLDDEGVQDLGSTSAEHEFDGVVLRVGLRRAQADSAPLWVRRVIHVTRRLLDRLADLTRAAVTRTPMVVARSNSFGLGQLAVGGLRSRMSSDADPRGRTRA